jgi:hypothetical protein
MEARQFVRHGHCSPPSVDVTKATTGQVGIKTPVPA